MHFQSKIILTEQSDEVLSKDFFSKINIVTEINYNLTLEIRPEESRNTIGIETVKEIANWMYRKSDLVKLAIIYNSELLTREAQNALLKVLEEPAENSILILICNNINSLLPTILSRCTVYNFRQKRLDDYGDQIERILYLKDVHTYKDFEAIFGEFNNTTLIDVLNQIRVFILNGNGFKEINNSINMIELLEKLEIASQNKVSEKQIITTLYTFITSTIYL